MATACENCGQYREDEDTYCGNCGTGASHAGPSPPPDPVGWSPVPPGPTVATSDGAANQSGFSVDAGVGQTTPNATYLGQRLLFEKEPEASFDPLLNDRFLFRLARQAVLFLGIYLL